MIGKQEAQRLVDAMLQQMRTPNNGFLSIEEATGKPAFADNVSLVEWINAARICPPDRTNVLVYGGIAQLHKDTGVWYTQMEQPERPIQWRVTHWAYIPRPSKALIDSVYPPKGSIILCDKCLADGTREPSIGLARFPNDATAHLCAQCAEEIVGPL
jgi:hypothetical protein